MKKNLQPISKWPQCVQVYLFKGAIMNAAGISNPGLKAVLDTDIWQKRKDPFLISIIPVRDTYKQRLAELSEAAFTFLG